MAHQFGDVKVFRVLARCKTELFDFFLGVGRYTSIAAVNGDMSWDSVYQQQWRNVMNQWCRIQLMDHNRLNYKIYQWSVSQGNPQRKNWSYRIKSMMSESNIGDQFLTSSVNMNKSFIKNHINEHIKNQETKTWLNDINRPESKRGNGRNNLRTYKLFKQTYSEEIYVKRIMQRSQRSSFAKFRLGVAPLRIEPGRYIYERIYSRG